MAVNKDAKSPTEATGKAVRKTSTEGKGSTVVGVDVGELSSWTRDLISMHDARSWGTARGVNPKIKCLLLLR